MPGGALQPAPARFVRLAHASCSFARARVTVDLLGEKIQSIPEEFSNCDQSAGSALKLSFSC